MVSYDGRVKPLRDTSGVHIGPPLVSYRVTGSSRDEKVNQQEALTITSLIAAATEQPEYQINEAGKAVSFGVASAIRRQARQTCVKTFGAASTLAHSSAMTST